MQFSGKGISRTKETLSSENDRLNDEYAAKIFAAGNKNSCYKKGGKQT